MISESVAGEMAAGRRTGRRLVLLGVPALYVLLGLLHPQANPELGDETDLFVGLHIAQLLLIMGLGYLLWFLVEGGEGDEVGWHVVPAQFRYEVVGEHSASWRCVDTTTWSCEPATLTAGHGVGSDPGCADGRNRP